MRSGTGQQPCFRVEAVGRLLPGSRLVRGMSPAYAYLGCGWRSSQGWRPGLLYAARLRGLTARHCVRAILGRDHAYLLAWYLGEGVRRRADFVGVARGFIRRSFFGRRGVTHCATFYPAGRSTRAEMPPTAHQTYHPPGILGVPPCRGPIPDLVVNVQQPPGVLPLTAYMSRSEPCGPSLRPVTFWK